VDDQEQREPQLQSNIQQLAQITITRASGLVENLRAVAEIPIDSIDVRTYVDDQRKLATRAIDALDERRMGFTRPIRALEKATNELFNPPLSALREIEQTLLQRVLSHDRLQQEAHRKRQQEEEERARKEQERLEKERKDQENLARQDAETARQAAANARAEGNDGVARQLEQQAKDSERKAELTAATPVQVDAPVVPPTPAKPKGASYERDNWVAEIVDAMKVPREYCMPSQVMLDAVAKNTQGKAQVPGVEFVNRPIAVRGRK